MSDQAACLAFTLSYEGGYVDNPADPGGATNYGITLQTFRTIMRNAKLGIRQLRALTKGQAEAAYWSNYYLPSRADLLPTGIDLMVGDFAVNAGVSRAIQTLQAACAIRQDGVAGPHTTAAASAADPRKLIGTLAAQQAQFYKGCRGFSVFGKGWLARVDARETTALNLQ